MAMVTASIPARRAELEPQDVLCLALAGICFAFAFPVLWLILTSLRPNPASITCIAAPNHPVNFKDVCLRRIVHASSTAP
jgi:ABC-type glycerol-3-phosphate transport system permease component